MAYIQSPIDENRYYETSKPDDICVCRGLYIKEFSQACIYCQDKEPDNVKTDGN